MMQTNHTWVTITYRYKCSIVLEIAVVESLFLALDETRDGCFNQGRRENFRAPGQKIRLGPLVSGAPKTHD